MDREKERARELEREVERERERQREVEMRSFREFSTKLPIVLRAPNARSAALGGAVLDEAPSGIPGNVYEGATGPGAHGFGGGAGVGLVPLKYDGYSGSGGGRNGMAGASPPTSMHSMGRIAPLDRGSKDPSMLPSSRQSSRQGSRQQGGQQHGQGASNYLVPQDFGPRLTTPISNVTATSVSGSDYYGNGFHSNTGAINFPPQSGAYAQNTAGGPCYGQASGGLGPMPSAVYRGAAGNMSNGNNFGVNPGHSSNLPQLQYSNVGGSQDVASTASQIGGSMAMGFPTGSRWDGDHQFTGSSGDYAQANSQGLKYPSGGSGVQDGNTISAPRGHGPGTSGPSGAHGHHRTQVNIFYARLSN